MTHNHNVSKEEVLESAKKVMNDFMQELNKVENAPESFGQKRQTNIRPLEHNNPVDHKFIERMFENAPKKKGQFIVAETQKRD